MQVELAQVGGGPGSPKGLFTPWDGSVGVLPIPAGAVALHATSGNQANANAVATFAATPAVTNYVTSIVITGGGATAAALVVATLAGLLGGTASFIYGAVAGAAAANPVVQIDFSTPLPASAVNTALVLTLPALGAGNTNACVEMFGFQK